jgi:hypothetical protein
MRRVVTAGLLLALASGCANPAFLAVIPLQDQDVVQVRRDREECEDIASRRRDRGIFFKQKFMAFAAAMTFLDPFSGFFVGDVGGTVVGIQSHQALELAYLNEYTRCLEGRGYRVRDDDRRARPL